MSKTKTATSFIPGTLIILAIIGALAFFGSMNPGYPPKSQSDDKVRVAMSVWTDVLPNGRISVVYSPPQGNDGGVSSFQYTKRWEKRMVVEHGTDVSLQAINGMTVRSLHIELKINGKSACKQKREYPGAVICSRHIP